MLNNTLLNGQVFYDFHSRRYLREMIKKNRKLVDQELLNKLNAKDHDFKFG